MQTTLLSKASKIISIKCSLPKPVAKTIFQLDGTHAFHCISLHFCLWLDSILFHRGESRKSQVCSRLQPIFSSRVLRLYISHFSVYKMEVCWLDCSQYPTYLYIMDLLFGSSFILLDSFQLDLAVYPGISLISPGLRLPAQEPFPSDPIFYSIVVLVEKRGSSTIL